MADWRNAYTVRPDAGPPEWVAFVRRMNLLQRCVLTALRQDRLPKLQRTATALEFGRRRRELYFAAVEVLGRDEVRQHVAGHVLIGSTPEYVICPKLDLPGRYSAKSFLRSYLAERRNVTKHLRRMNAPGIG